MWVLNCGGTFPCGVFDSREQAETAIRKYGLTGTLTEYPVNQLVYDWTIEKGYFQPKNEQQRTPGFIGGFSSAHQRHYHYTEDDEGCTDA